MNDTEATLTFFAALAAIAFGLGRRVRHGHGGAGRAVAYGLLAVLLTALLGAIAWIGRDLLTFDGQCRAFLQPGFPCTVLAQVGHSVRFVGLVALLAVLVQPLLVALALAIGGLAGWAGWRFGGFKRGATQGGAQDGDGPK